MIDATIDQLRKIFVVWWQLKSFSGPWGQKQMRVIKISFVQYGVNNTLAKFGCNVKIFASKMKWQKY